MISGPPYDHIYFDCDSTLTTIEGIDTLAHWAGAGQELEELTAAAMDGRTPLDKVYKQRLDRIRPCQAAIQKLANYYVEHLVEGSRELISILNSLGKTVGIISGGVHQAVIAVADTLNISSAHVYAVRLSFDDCGEYRGFDQSSPLSKSDGKAQIIRQHIPQKTKAVLVGDGMTDVAAAEAGIAVIGYGGVVHREMVCNLLKTYLTERNLLCVLQYILTEREFNQVKLI
ncbi:MAG: HAD-IB family phosphatase [Gammaproteobacteria bacterium]|nr:HAD-IB family phosphatase [Gammaproteobacteria bacterium]